jgi:hypothetical protein
MSSHSFRLAEIYPNGTHALQIIPMAERIELDDGGDTFDINQSIHNRITLVE